MSSEKAQPQSFIPDQLAAAAATNAAMAVAVSTQAASVTAQVASEAAATAAQAASEAASTAAQAATAAATTASSRAGAYLSSWGSWAAEKRKTGWSKQATGLPPAPAPPPPSKEEILWRGDEELRQAEPVKVEASQEAHGEHGDAVMELANYEHEEAQPSLETGEVVLPTQQHGYDFDEHLVAPERAAWDD